MKSLLISTALAVSVLVPFSSLADDAQTRYASRYFIAGFLTRAATVCQGADWKRTVSAGMDLLGSPEFRAMSRGFPKQTGQWMMEGANNFNTGVMKDGIGAACSYALTRALLTQSANGSRRITCTDA